MHLFSPISRHILSNMSSRPVTITDIYRDEYKHTFGTIMGYCKYLEDLGLIKSIIDKKDKRRKLYSLKPLGMKTLMLMKEVKE